MAMGTVKNFNVDLGSGIVAGDDGNTYAVHHKDIAGMTVGASSFRTLRVDQRVTFESQETTVGGIGGSKIRKAINVAPMR